MSSFPAADFILGGIFGVFVAATAAGGLLAALSTRVIRGVCGLAMCCVGLAGLYYFLQSPFLALMEILIYVGAICVTIVFAVMLAEPDEPKEKNPRRATIFWGSAALITSLAVFGTLAALALGGSWPAPAPRLNEGTVEAIGISLLTTYSLAFEMISLVLLVAILGALAIAQPGRAKP